MTWWCSATGVPWTWEWRAYPGVWLFIAALAGLGYLAIRGRPRAAQSGLLLALGLGLLWIALDWPLGALGGYLASAHTGQFILIALSAPPFLLLSVRPAAAALPEGSTTAGVLGQLARPLPPFVGYNLILLVTHFPAIVDGLMASQLGSFWLDSLWLLAGFLLWWPVTAPARYRRLSPPLQMAYLFVQTIPATLPAAFLIFATYPLYQLYELAPRVTSALTPLYDHQVAGLLMKVVGDPVVWIGIATVFFRWANAERRADLGGVVPAER